MEKPKETFEKLNTSKREKSSLFSHLQEGVLEFERPRFLAPSFGSELG